MHRDHRLNPIDELCQNLSLAYLSADKNDPKIHDKYVDAELDGLYEFAKIVFSVSREEQFLPKTAQLLLEAIGLQVSFPAAPDLDLSDGPHIFVANRAGCGLVDAAIGSMLTSRFGLAPTIVCTKNQHLPANSKEVISIEHPRIQLADPRNNVDIAQKTAQSVMRMRSDLTKGRCLLFFPGAGTFRTDHEGQVLFDGNFDRLAPVLLACKDLNPKLHLFHIDYEMPSWWTKLLEKDQARFHAAQWKAVLGLERQIANVRMVKTIAINPSIDQQQRFNLCRRLFDLTAKITLELSRTRQLAAA